LKKPENDVRPWAINSNKIDNSRNNPPTFVPKKGEDWFCPSLRKRACKCKPDVSLHYLEADGAGADRCLTLVNQNRHIDN
jgi:hypothetical protein